MPNPTKAQLDELLAFLPALETPGRSFDEERGSEKQPDGSITFPWLDYAPDVVAFFRCASQPCFADVDYPIKNPGSWLKNPDFIQNCQHGPTHHAAHLLQSGRAFQYRALAICVGT